MRKNTQLNFEQNLKSRFLRLPRLRRAKREALINTKFTLEKLMKVEKLKKRLIQDIKKLKAAEGHLLAGIPNFRALFGRDSCISAWQLLKINPIIARNTLKILSRYQGKIIDDKGEEEPGKILHTHYPRGVLQKLKSLLGSRIRKRKIIQYSTWKFPYYGSIDSTAWFLILLSDYYSETKDQKLVKKLWPNVKKAISWIERYGDRDKDGFIEYQRRNPQGLFHQAWKDGLEIYIQPPIAMVEVQGYYYSAYKKIAKISRDLIGDSELAENLEKKARVLKKKFNQDFWLDDQNYFALALDGKKEKIEIITSNPGHCLFTGIIDDKKVKKVARRLFKKDIWTSFGIRTHSSEDLFFNPLSYQRGSIWPHDNWIIYKGLQKYGYLKEAKMIKKALISAFKELGHIPELYTFKDNKILPLSIACSIQAWASGGLLEMIWETSNGVDP